MFIESHKTVMSKMKITRQSCEQLLMFTMFLEWYKYALQASEIRTVNTGLCHIRYIISLTANNIFYKLLVI
jgi:hypothetical protein